MGAVYRAFDPELNRNIAIKLLKLSRRGRALARERMLREAQALAQLSHPNVIAIHDVGTFDEGVFIAMELVEGKTVSQWLASERPSWRQILEVFLAAGEGLSAAHTRGLIHRDVKPSNIMIGNDGRVRILDFGLARPMESNAHGDSADPASPRALDLSVRSSDSTETLFRTIPDPLEDDASEPAPALASMDPSSAASTALYQQLTRTGTLIGTPAYMAPEQLLDGEVGPRSDQFSFCVSLYRALCGKRPFPGTAVQDRITALMCGEASTRLDETRIPRWLRAAVLRGLESDPGERWPSMDALLSTLRRNRDRHRRWIGKAATSSVAIVAVLVGTWLVATPEVCSGASEQIAEVWSPRRRAALLQAMNATDVPYAPVVSAQVSARFDNYARAWAAAHTEACEATAVRQEQSSAMLDQRMACLAGRRQALDELAAILTQADPAAVARAVSAAATLPSIDACSDLAYLSSLVAPPSDEQTAAAARDQRRTVARIEQLRLTAQYQQALALAEPAQAAAEAIGYPPLHSELELALGRLRWNVGDYGQARTHLEEAFFSAQRLRYTAVAGEAALSLVNMLIGQQDSDAATTWARHGDALLANEGDRILRARFDIARGTLARTMGQLEEAEALQRQALAALESHEGPGGPHVPTALDGLAAVLTIQGKLDEAEVMFRRALDMQRASMGEHHPAVARALCQVAVVLDRKGAYTEAVALNRQALAIREQVLGPDHPEVGAVLVNLSAVLDSAGQHAEAIEVGQRALTLTEKRFGPEHPNTARVHIMLGGALGSLGRITAARAHFEQALANFEAGLGPEHPQVSQALVLLGWAMAYSGDYEHAQALLERARALVARVYGSDHREMAKVLPKLAMVALRRGRFADAEALAQKTMDIHARLGALGRPIVFEPLLIAGQAKLFQGDFGAAAALFDQAQVLATPADSMAHTALPLLWTTQAELAWYQGALDTAAALLERARAEIEADYGADSVYLVAVHIAFGRLAEHHQRWAEADTHYHRARTLLVDAGVPVHPDAAVAAAGRARALLARGRAAHASALAEDALAQIGEHSAPAARADIRFALARALVATATDRAGRAEARRRARSLVDQAAVDYRALGPLYAPERSALTHFRQKL